MNIKIIAGKESIEEWLRIFKILRKDDPLKTSEEWQSAFPRTVIIDPDGWDRSNFRYSFYEEKITLEEYNSRLTRSTVTCLK